jgi:hypothetical protein
MELRMSDSYCRECGDSGTAQLRDCCADRLRETFDTSLSVVAALCQRNMELREALVELIQYHEFSCLWSNETDCSEPVDDEDEQCVNCRALRAAGYFDEEDDE